MSYRNGPKIVSNGLVLLLDAGNSKSYESGSTNWGDLSRNGNNGTLTNGPTYSSGNGGSIVFDGTNDYVSVAYNSSLDTPNGATYELWLYFGGTAGTILTRGTSDSGATPDNPRLYTYSSGQLYWDWSSPGSDKYMYSPVNCNTGAWNHIEGTATPGSYLGLYINGVNATGSPYGGTLPNPLYNSGDPIIVGGATWIPNYYTGNIASVRLYNRVLSSNEILQNYNATRRRFGL